MSQTELPLSETDLQRIRSRVQRTQSAIRVGSALAIAAHIATAAFFLSTPTDFSQPGKVALGLCTVLLVGGLFWLFVIDARRSRTGLLAAELRNKKVRVLGTLTQATGPTDIQIDGVTLAAWPEIRASLRPGDTADAEHIGQRGEYVQLRCVLRINGSDNPYFDTVVRSGPPGA